MKTKYIKVEIRGEMKRLYYYPELTKHRKVPAAIFSRFATYVLEMVTSGDRLRDKQLAREIITERGLDWEQLCKDHDIHHHPLCNRLEWIPRDIHRKVVHRGGISIIKDGLKELT